MVVDHVDLEVLPSSLTQEPYDCVWLLLSQKKRDKVFNSKALQYIDWKMRGFVSHFVLGERRETTFVPTIGKMATPWLAMTVGEWSWDYFFSSCQGMKFKKVFCLLEDSSGSFEKKAEAFVSEAYPEHLLFAMGDSH